MTVTVNSNGQITIPAKIRRQLWVKSWTKVEIIMNEDGTASILPTQPVLHRSELHTFLKTDIVLSDQELGEAISNAFRPSDIDQYGK